MIGRSVTRSEDHRLLTGRGQYVDDLDFPGVLHMTVVRSPHPHARIASVSTAAARSMPGVHGVFAASDIGHLNRPWPEHVPHPSLRAGTLRALPIDKVRYVGEAVAVVVAESRYLAEDARDAVEVDYVRLTGFGSCESALEANGEPIHEVAPDNVAAHDIQRTGDVEAALLAAPHRLRETFRIMRGGGHSMECRGVAARYDEALASFTVWDSTQVPHQVQRLLAHCFDMADARFRVIVPDVGGGFGPKAGIYAEEVLVAWVARELRRPVKWIEDRYEHFVASMQEREQVHEVEVGFDDEGHVHGLKDVFLHDCGAFAPHVIGPSITTATVPGPYRIPNLHIEFRAMYTNMVQVGAVRGAGRPQAVFVMERVMDRIAQELDLDPAEVRSRNLIQADEFPYKVGLMFRDGSPLTYDSGDFPGLLARTLQIIDYPAHRSLQARLRAEGRCRGIGVAIVVEGGGYGPFEGASIRIDQTGKVTLALSAPPAGQGHATTFAQVCAHFLGVPMGDIKVIACDTDRVPFGVGTFASRVVTNTAPAVMSAATQLKSKILRSSAVLLSLPEEELDLADGQVMHKDKGKVISLADVAWFVNVGVPGMTLPDGVQPGLEAVSYFAPSRAVYSSSVQVCVVDVDPETGEIRIVDHAIGHDCGKQINPLLVKGQVLGGLAHGLSGGILEQAVYAPDGQPLTISYVDYTLPSALEIPRVKICELETASPLNPLGVKGAGEVGTLAAPAAVAAAIEDALARFSVRISSIPVHPPALADLVAQAKRAGGTPTSVDIQEDSSDGSKE
ncbi:MAG: molybdopterin cofactor-binding domain-containing protein [Streptosporangiaceae bacterium]